MPSLPALSPLPTGYETKILVPQFFFVVSIAAPGRYLLAIATLSVDVGTRTPRGWFPKCK